MSSLSASVRGGANPFTLSRENSHEGGLSSIHGARLPKNNAAATRPPADFEQFKTAGEQLKSHLRGSSRGPVTIPLSGLEPALSAMRGTWRDLTSLVSAINHLPPPLSERDPRIGEALTPLAVKILSQGAASGNDALLVQLYIKTHKDSAGKPRLALPAFLQGISGFLSLAPLTNDLPSHEAYLRVSPSLKGTLAEIEARIEEKSTKLAEREAMNQKSVARGHNTYGTIIDGMKEELSRIKGEIPVLFERLSDVPPEVVPEVTDALGMRVSLASEVFQSTFALTKSLEGMIYATMTSSVKGGETHKLQIPFFTDSGKIGVDSLSFGATELKEIASNPSLLSFIMDSYLDLRNTLLELYPTVEPFPSLRDASRVTRELLARPFSRLGEKGEAGWEALVKIQDEEVKKRTLALITTPIAEQTGEQQWGHSLECSTNISPLMWVVKGAIHSSPQAPHYLDALRESPRLAGSLAEFCSQIRTVAARKDFQGLTRLITEEIRKAKASTDLFEQITPLAALAAILEDRSCRERLKNQISNSTDLKDIAASIAAQNSAIGSRILEITHAITKALSSSMADFYRDPEMQELWDFLEDYKLFLKRPDCLEGVAGNEAMRSGILVAGDPGVGKTFFVNCLATDLNLKLFTISPDEGEALSTKRMIDACKNTIKQAKTHAEKTGPCILFIDEAEAMMADRENPRTSPEQVELTCYLLQQINEIREKHPKILLVAVTNFPEKIDAGMFRDGRFDVQLLIGKPSTEMRKALIRDTLAKEKIALQLEDDQLTDLVNLTEGLMPLPIKRTIRQLNRITRIRAETAGEPFEITFDLLKSQFEIEKKRRQTPFVERVLAARKKHGASDVANESDISS